MSSPGRPSCSRPSKPTAKAADGFRVQPRRRVVERTFAWLVQYRRLVADYEYPPQTSEAMIRVATIHLMARRLEPGR